MTSVPAVVVGASWNEFVAFLEGGEPAGHVTAAAWVFDPARRSVLLVEHRSLGWSCPGGHLEPGETAVDAAVRELAEETGLHLAPTTAEPIALTRTGVCTRPDTFGHAHWTLGYRFHGSEGEGLAPETAQPARWFAIDELPWPRASDLDAVAPHLT